MEFFSEHVQQNYQTIQRFDMLFRQYIAERHGFIKPPHFDTSRKFPLNQIYVTPQISIVHRDNKVELQDYHYFVGGLRRAVILGQPGGGKTSMTLKIAYDLATNTGIN